ncbi:MAG: glycosyltransferase, partial [Proteobacteria bacterium]
MVSMSEETRIVIENSGLFDTGYYLARYPEAQAAPTALDHWLEIGLSDENNPNPFFDTKWYLESYAAHMPTDANPLEYYITTGWRLHHDPSPNFSVEEYLSRNKDVRDAGIEPLSHFIRYGIHEARPFFKSANAGFHFPIISPSANGAQLNPEPGIKPVPFNRSSATHVGETNSDILAYLRHLRTENKSSAASAYNEVESAYAFHKLSLARDAENVLTRSLREKIDGFDARDALLAAGLSPVYEADKTTIPLYNVPILDRYNASRIEIYDRLRLDPAAASTESGSILFSIVVPVYKSPLIFLERAILSVICQRYSSWELILVDDYSDSVELDSLLEYYSGIDSRIKYIKLAENSGISAATNAAIRIAGGSYIALMDHDDMITVDALAEVYEAIMLSPSLDWVYSDEAKIDEDDIPDEIYTKPDWSPYLLLNLMYTGHFSVYRKSIIDKLGGFRTRFDLSQDYDLALRVSELAPHVHHIRKCLYGWRMIPGSASVGGKPTARQTNLAALQSASDRRGYGGIAIGLPSGNRVISGRAALQPTVSIVVPSDNFENILATVQTIVSETTYVNFEILVVTNSLLIAKKSHLFQQYDVRFVPYDLPYNFSDKCNRGAEVAKGEFIVFFNDDVRVVTSNWIEVLVEAINLPEVGAVAPKLLY